MMGQGASWINALRGGEMGGGMGDCSQNKGERIKTEFQTCNLSNPQSCENDWGGKGEEGRGTMDDWELERGLISN